MHYQKLLLQSLQVFVYNGDNSIRGGADLDYKIHYYCWSHVGKCRSMNQDNFICAGKFMDGNDESLTFPLAGYLTCGHPTLIGIFDGMGGEDCGEVASLLAAESALGVSIGEKPAEDLLKFCKDANERICQYATENGLSAMGTTAALLAFTDSEITLCNIGDSKIFRFANKKLEQISVDHYAVAAYGRKPPLSQNLGIPPSEMVIVPHVAKGYYNNGDIYLLCSDGLTDMVTTADITKILVETDLDEAANKLIDASLENGGKDNITIILCKIEREKGCLLSRILRSKIKKKEK